MIKPVFGIYIFFNALHGFRWYYSDVNPHAVKKVKWSNLTYEEYIDIQNDICNYLSKFNQSPFVEEWSIWPEWYEKSKNKSMSVNKNEKRVKKNMKSNFTNEYMTKKIFEWLGMKKLSGELNFNVEYCDSHVSDKSRKYLRYWTNEMSKYIPENCEELSGWKNEHFYFYEIICTPTLIKFQLAFSYTNISDVSKNVCDQIFNNYHMEYDMPTKDSNFRILWKLKDIKYRDYEDESAIISELDKRFYQMMGYESFMIGIIEGLTES